MDDKAGKIRVKVGEHEFEAEGPADTIQQQYSAFLAAVAALGRPAPAAPTPEAQKPPQNPGVVLPAPPADSGTAPDRDALKRVFAEKDAVISLLALPKTETADADSLLLLLYGYHELRQSEYPVTGVRMMQAAKQSGLHQVDRIDRIIKAHEKYVNAAGARRGRKYSLNNQGITKAREIIKAVLNGG